MELTFLRWNEVDGASVNNSGRGQSGLTVYKLSRSSENFLSHDPGKIKPGKILQALVMSS
jgi:hypothetical protein